MSSVNESVSRLQEELAAEHERLRQMGRQYQAAMRDMALLDNCQVCGWSDNGHCRRPPTKGGSCFAWRGAERARLWEL